MPQRLENTPNRLLEITSVNGSSEIKLRLIEVSELKESYIALSHSWGNYQLLSSTTENYRSHLDRIKFEDLPKTFKDTIMVSKSLGVKFVWIDSLCIIQNSIEDWERECPRMASIYANAIVTIFASDSRNSSIGFLKDYNTGMRWNLWGGVEIRCIPLYGQSPPFDDVPSLLSKRR